MSATSLLRPGLLQGVSLLVAGPPGDAGLLGDAGSLGDARPPGDAGPPGSAAPLGVAVARACALLGARVSTCLPDGEDEAAIDAAVSHVGDIDMLVVDGAGLFDRGAPTALRACLDSTWNVTRAVINHAFLPAARGGRIVYLAPTPHAGEHAMAARAGLENLARTLSVEWARHDVNLIAIAPRGGSRGGPASAGLASAGLGSAGPGLNAPAEQLAALVAYLASPAGIYFSGCLLDLDTIP